MSRRAEQLKKRLQAKLAAKEPCKKFWINDQKPKLEAAKTDLEKRLRSLSWSETVMDTFHGSCHDADIAATDAMESVQKIWAGKFRTLLHQVEDYLRSGPPKTIKELLKRNDFLGSIDNTIHQSVEPLRYALATRCGTTKEGVRNQLSLNSILAPNSSGKPAGSPRPDGEVGGGGAKGIRG